MKNQVKKLVLSKETLRNFEEELEELKNVHGGAEPLTDVSCTCCCPSIEEITVKDCWER